MGTRKSKHNRGRKPEYKEHHASEVFEKKRALPDPVESPPWESSGDYIPQLQPVTCGTVTTDRVVLEKPKKMLLAPKLESEFLAAQPSHASPMGKKGKKRGSKIAKAFALNVHVPTIRVPSARTYVGETLRRRTVQRLKDKHWHEHSKEFFLWLRDEYAKSRAGLFFKIFAIDQSIEFALPECAHELDPSTLCEMLENINFARLAVAMGYSELEIRNFNRKA